MICKKKISATFHEAIFFEIPNLEAKNVRILTRIFEIMRRIKQNKLDNKH